MSGNDPKIRLRVVVDPQAEGADRLAADLRRKLGGAVGAAMTDADAALARAARRLGSLPTSGPGAAGVGAAGAAGALYAALGRLGAFGQAGVAAGAGNRLGTVPPAVQQRLAGLGIGGGGPVGAGALAGITTGAQASAKALGQVANVLASVGRGLQGLAAGVYLLERMGRAARGVAGAGLGAVRGIIESDDEDRKFELGISGVVGGANVARRVNDAVYRVAKSSPLSVREIQDAARSVASNPTLAPRLASGSVDDIAAEIGQHSRLVNKLSALRPEQPPQSANIAISELVAGNFTSIQRRFNVAPSAIAAAVGRPLEELKRDPALALRATSQWVDLFLPEEVLNNAGSLVSTRLKKLQDVYLESARGIANSGLYDKVVDRLQSIGGDLERYFGGDPQWVKQAQRTSDALGRILDNLLGATGKFLAGLTGAKTPAQTIAGVMDQVTTAIELLATGSEGLPAVGETIGRFLGDVGREVRNITTDIADLVDEMSAFKVGRNLFGQTGIVTKSQLAEAEKLRATRVVDYLNDRGIVGAKVNPIEGLDYNQTAGATFDRPIKYVEGYTIETSGIRDPRLARIASKAIDAIEGSGKTEFVTRRYIERVLEEKGILDQVRSIGSTSPTTRPATTQAANGGTYYSALSDVLRREGVLPNLGLTIAPALNRLARIDRDDVHDPLREVFRKGDVFGVNLGSDKDRFTIGDAFGRLNTRYSTERDTYLKALSEATDPGQADFIRRDLGKLSVRYDALRGQLVESMVTASRDYGLALADVLGDVPPAARAVLLDKIGSGTTAVAENVRRALVAAGEGAAVDRLGFDALPIRDRLTVSKEYTAARLSGLETGMGLPLGTPVEDVVRVGMRGGPSDETTKRRMLDFLQRDPRGFARAKGLYADALRNANPSNEASLVDLGLAQQQLTDVVAKMRDLSLATNDALASFISFGDQVESHLEGGIGDTIERLILGTGKLADVWKSFALSIVHDFSTMAGHNITRALFGAGGDEGRSGIGAIFGNLYEQKGGDTGGIVGGLINAFTKGGGKAYADGGVISRPVVGLVGERGPEAIVPLPNGRSVPVELMGGGEGGWHGNMYVVHDVEEAFMMGMNRRSDAVVSLLGNDFRKGGKSYRALRNKQSA